MYDVAKFAVRSVRLVEIAIRHAETDLIVSCSIAFLFAHPHEWQMIELAKQLAF